MEDTSQEREHKERTEKTCEALDLESSSLNKAQRQQVRNLIARYSHVFALSRDEVGQTHLVEHTIPLTSNVPVRCKYRPVPLHAIDDCIEEIDALLRRGVIERTDSEYSSPVVIVKKPNKFRICVDYRELNKISIASRAALPALSTLTSTFHGCKYFCSLDLREAFYQVPIKEEHRDRTAWTIPSIGHFRNIVMSLGLKGCPATMQSLLDKLLEGLRHKAAGYVDDIIAGGITFEEMFELLTELFRRLESAGLKLHPDKCKLFQKKVSFAGADLTEDGIEVDQKKIEAIQDMCLPKTKKMMMALLGSFNWFRNVVKDFAELTRPMINTLKEPKFVLTEDATESIKKLKDALTKAPILIYPITTEPLHLFTDSSSYCIGGSIGHMIDGQFHPISYGSKILSPAERAYPTFKRELLALKHFTTHWRFYTIGKPFIVHVDHKAISQDKFLRKTNCDVLLSWIMELEEYDFKITYTKGDDMGLPDALSRLPQQSDMLYEWWEDRFSSVEKKDEFLETIKTNQNEYDARSLPHVINPVSVDTESSSDSDHDSDAPCSRCSHSSSSGPQGGQSTLGKKENKKKQKRPSGHASLLSSVTVVNDRASETEEDEEEQSTGPVGSFDNPIPAPNVSSGALLDAQLEDETLSTVRSWSLNGKPEKRDTIGYNEDLRQYYSCFESLTVNKKNLLCYKWKGTKKYRLLICVPKELKEEMMYNNHDIPASGHLGPAKTLERLRNSFFWPKMKTEVQLYCNTCKKCFLPNLAYKAKPKAELQPFSVARPNELVCIDLIGPLTRVDQYKWCLTMVDKFTNWVVAVPLTDAKSPTIARALINSWIVNHGVPERILSDQGANLDASKVMKELYNVLQIQKSRTTAYKPSTNGLAENKNKQIKVALTKYIGENPDQWPERIGAVTFAMNSSVCKSSGFTPFFLLHGREARVPNDLVFGTTSSEYYQSQHHLASRLYHQLKETWELAAKNIKRAQQQQKRYYDKCVRLTEYNVGDKVMVYVPAIKPGREYNKFKLPLTGPHTILRKLGTVNFEIVSDETGKEQVVHFDKLRKLPTNFRTDPMLPNPVEPEEEEDPEKSDSDSDDDAWSPDYSYFGQTTTHTEPVPESSRTDAPMHQDVPEDDNDQQNEAETHDSQQSQEPRPQPTNANDRVTRRAGLRPKAVLRAPARNNDISRISCITEQRPYY